MVGIDLGTTNSVVAVIENDVPKIIQNAEGQPKTPSVVAFLESGDVVVGEIARRQSATQPHRTISSAKRLLGRYKAELEAEDEIYPFPLGEDETGRVTILVNGHVYRPEQISSLILKKLKAAAEEYLGEPVEKAIITVPAYFDDIQRHATLEAARLAGLEVPRLINEPTAAAMAYGLDKAGQETVAIYDFGGGTFDFSVLDIDHKTFEVLTSTGNSRLGGDDLDMALVDYAAERFTEAHGIDLRADVLTLRRVKDEMERVKCELSTATRSVINLPFIAYAEGKPLHLQETLTRETLEQIIEPYVAETLRCCELGLREANLRKGQLTKVILVGGSTRIPLVQEMVEEFFGMAPFRGVNPDEIVAIGAATQAAVLGGQLEEVVLLDVTPHTLGIEVKGDRRSVLIEKNATIPIKVAKTFTTTENHQSFVNIHLLQGESPRASENRSLGKFTLSGIPEGPAGAARIRVEIFVNADGVVEVSATDSGSGVEKRLTATFAHLSAEERRARQGVSDPTQRRRRRRRPVPAMGPGLGALAETPSQPRPAAAAPEPDITPLPAEPAPAAAARTPPQPAVAPPATAAATPPPAPAPAPAAAGQAVLAPLSFEPPAALREVVGLLLEQRSDEAATAIYERDQAAFLEFVRERTDDLNARCLAARLLILCKQPEDARRELVEIGEAWPDRKRELLDVYDLLCSKYPNYLAARRDRAELAYALGELKTTIQDLEFVAKRSEGETQVYGELARVYGQYLETTKDATIQFRLVKMHLRTGDLDQAITLLQQLVQVPEYRQRADKALGLCFWQKGLRYLALQKFKTLPLDDEMKDQLYRLAQEMEDNDELLHARYALERIYEVDINYKDVAERLRKLTFRIDVMKDERFGESPTGSPSPIDVNAATIRESLIGDRFELLGEINRGSMGIVYRAHDRVLDEVVAIKVLNDFLCADPQAVARFKQECRSARRLTHPNIVRIHDFLDLDSKKLISMEFIKGEDLKTILARSAPLPESAILEYLKQLCDGIAYAHRLGIVHRDIKPANILLDEGHHVKVTDFGIAKVLDAAATKAGTMIMGTPLYMAPEQIQGEKIDQRVDIYALGIMLFEMATGAPPFNEGSIEYHHLNTPVPPIEADLSEDLKRIIYRCVEKDPDKRYQSIEELLMDLPAIGALP